MRFRHPRLKRALILVSVLFVVMMSASQAPVANAALIACRADPVFTLSDGTILDLSVDIGTAVANVREIHYVVHGPRGVGLLIALRTPTLGFAGKETVTYYGDALPNQYITDTLVRTTTTNVSVTSYTTFVGNRLGSSLALLSLQYEPIRGFNDQNLIATLTK